ncbi:MAG: tRNA epoxyqueuosine(34) reductase QueG [Phycisphaerae bacterium]|nr:tRNA epoxyqueuosine(34) reductase QueG [Phycisphaerae bacterium]
MAEPDNAADPAALAATVKRLAIDVGFDRAGIAAAAPLGREAFLRDWLAAGHAGQMAYLHRYSDKRNDPSKLLRNARSVICLARDCPRDGACDRPGELPDGYIARYARGTDYHLVLKQLAFLLLRRIRKDVGACEAMVAVDTKPLLEKELAARAGIGWIGKNTLLNHPAAGSHCLLAEIVTTLDLAPDAPMPDHCGRCRRCIDACPTRAIVAPGTLDAARCVSYLTIELRDAIPEDLRPAVGPRLYGCDRCQDVCPFNARPPASAAEPPPADLPDRLDPRAVLGWAEDDYTRAIAGTAAERATLAMWRRNAAVAVANANPTQREP